ncbi:MAG: RNA polymerase sporulation sigma factor SigK [Lachnospiraceae bacterium]|nr:RNA polymerase sporulation sigma factor SigK [Lachnospiraceae bacterium]
MKTFQKPLSFDEEVYYIQLMKNGSKTEAAKAREILIERNLRLVAHIAKKYQNTEDELDDLISIGTIGLIKAINSFDEKKGSRIGTYAARCIDNELLMMLRGKKKISKEVSIYEPIGVDREGNEINLLDVIECEQVDVIDRMELSGHLRLLGELFEKLLSKREKQILTMRYGLFGTAEVTQREIGKKLGISRSYVSRIEKKALLKLYEGFKQSNI